MIPIEDPTRREGNSRLTLNFEARDDDDDGQPGKRRQATLCFLSCTRETQLPGLLNSQSIRGHQPPVSFFLSFFLFSVLRTHLRRSTFLFTARAPDIGVLCFRARVLFVLTDKTLNTRESWPLCFPSPPPWPFSHCPVYFQEFFYIAKSGYHP